MPGNQWSDKRERQYEHIKDGLKERGKDDLGYGTGVAAGELAEAIDKGGAFVERRDEWKVVLFPQNLIFGAAAGSDVYQPGALGFADFAPRDDLVR